MRLRSLRSPLRAPPAAACALIAVDAAAVVVLAVMVDVELVDVADAAALERPNRRELVSAVAEEGIDGLGRGEEDEGLSADEGAEVDSMFLPTRKTL